MAFQEESGYESGDTFAEEDTIPDLIQCDDSDSEEESDMENFEAEAVSKEPKVPSTLVSAHEIGQVKQPKALVGLLDSGGLHCLINAKALPKGALQVVQKEHQFTTTAGSLQSAASTTIDKLALPEFT